MAATDRLLDELAHPGAAAGGLRVVGVKARRLGRDDRGLDAMRGGAGGAGDRNRADNGLILLAVDVVAMRGLGLHWHFLMGRAIAHGGDNATWRHDLVMIPRPEPGRRANGANDAGRLRSGCCGLL